MPSLSVRVHPQTEQIHLSRESTRIGLAIDMAETPQLIDDLQRILAEWPLRRQIEREHDEAITRGPR